MKNKIVLMASLCLLLMTVAVSAQNKNFAGDWTLQKDKSELGERNRIESMTMKVSQDEKQLTVERKAKLAEGEGRGGGMGGGRGGGEMPAIIYSLDGSETKVNMGEGRMGGEVKLKAKAEKDGKLKLTQTRSFETQMGSVSVKMTETWELSADGKTLTVSSETETPRGNRNSKMVFTKN